jgi:hypothetical protein
MIGNIFADQVDVKLTTLNSVLVLSFYASALEYQEITLLVRDNTAGGPDTW